VSRDLAEPLVGEAAGAIHGLDDVVDAKGGPDGVLTDEVEGVADANIRLRQLVRRLSAAEHCRTVFDRYAAKSGIVDPCIEQSGEFIAGFLKVWQNAGECRPRVLANELVVVNADDIEVAGNVQPQSIRFGNDLLGGKVVGGEYAAGTGRFLQCLGKVAGLLENRKRSVKARHVVTECLFAFHQPERRDGAGVIEIGGAVAADKFGDGRVCAAGRIVNDIEDVAWRRFRILVKKDDRHLGKEGNWTAGEGHAAIHKAAERFPQFELLAQLCGVHADGEDLYLPVGFPRIAVDALELVSPAFVDGRLKEEHDFLHVSPFADSITNIWLFVLDRTCFSLSNLSHKRGTIW